MKEHWDRVYEKTANENLGWYEENPEPSLRLIGDGSLAKNDGILNVGTGASTMVDELLSHGFRNITATDIILSAIEALQKRLGPEQSKKVNWICHNCCPQFKGSYKMIEMKSWNDWLVL